VAGSLSSRRAQRALLKLGFVLKHIEGSHHIFVAPNSAVVSIPLGHREVLEFIIRKELERGGVTWQAFRDAY
jgi:predicted RNA binding protein YcfA (HicA-like mRNA interferase family)